MATLKVACQVTCRSPGHHQLYGRNHKIRRPSPGLSTTAILEAIDRGYEPLKSLHYKEAARINILIYSRVFAPSIGGLEAMMQMLAEGFVRHGQEVKVVSATPDDGNMHFSFEVVRNPSVRRLLTLVRWSDVVLQGGPSLKGLWPFLFVNRRLVISHHIWLANSARGYLKRFISTLVTNISVSRALARDIPVRSAVISNCYRDDVFYEYLGIIRSHDLVFVGRLIPDKGLNVLVDALSSLAVQGFRPSLTIIGAGPEQDHITRRVAEEGLSMQVRFDGIRRGPELAKTLNAHRLVVVPSTCEEAFGIVALEGIACGCVVVGSDGGGLPEAIGPCGITVPRGNHQALAMAIETVLTNSDMYNSLRACARGHLARHTRDCVVQAYLNVLRNDRMLAYGQTA